jgi:uncharacterized protein YggE
MATLTVRGRAAVPAVPDEATVALELSALQPSADAAYRDVAGRNVALGALCDELGIAAAARSTAGVSVGPHVEYVDGREQHRGYRSVNRVLVRFEDPELVARLLQEAVERVEARVEGPWWRIRPDNPAHTEARRLAAEDARLRAETYAAALGVRLGALEHVAEPEVKAGVPPPVGRAAFAAIEAGPPIQVDPGEQLVSAAVDVSFVLEQG